MKTSVLLSAALIFGQVQGALAACNTGELAGRWHVSAFGFSGNLYADHRFDADSCYLVLNTLPDSGTDTRYRIGGPCAFYLEGFVASEPSKVMRVSKVDCRFGNGNFTDDHPDQDQHGVQIMDGMFENLASPKKRGQAIGRQVYLSGTETIFVLTLMR